LRAFEVACRALQPRSRDADVREHEHRMSLTDGGLRGASQALAMQRLALGLIEASARGARQRKAKVRQRHRPGIRLKSLAREAMRPLPRRLAKGPGVIQGEPLGDVLRIAVSDPPSWR
jgi:hypothetical protein